jgi:GntR family transcriptional regulator / MocR family aminotransferase
VKRNLGYFAPVIDLTERTEAPMYRRLYDGFRKAILDGRIRPGQRVPSSRGLAAELGISRISVLSAYEQLLSEGYFETFTGAGTSVAQSIPDEAYTPPEHYLRSQGRASSPKAGRRRVSQLAEASARLPAQSWCDNLGAFRVSLPALKQFPIDQWSKLVARNVRTSERDAMAYGNAMGYLPFREAIAEYLGAARGVRCDSSQILVTTGSQQALQLCAQVLLNFGDRVCMEEPGYPGARDAFRAIGAEVVPIALDPDGIDVASMTKRAPSARAVYVTPSHQYPMGMAMSATRRMLLLRWAASTDAWIIEDDYDSEYRFNGRPIAALQGMDAHARVIYLGTFSKVMFPALRLGYLVVPDDLVSAFCAARETADGFSSTLYQLTLNDFMREGHFVRHIRRMRMLYMDRRKSLIQAINTQMKDTLEVVGDEAGMHLVGLLPPRVNDVTIARDAAKLGISAMPLSSCYSSPPQRGGLILGYGGASAHEIRVGVRLLKRVCEHHTH